ncbi:dual oxidase 2 [Procambarus clarkii]|uniref:dual oxidase 2 n=1 Tax=Procambarus clarkii TaxID=6728 RepID=UPI003741FCA3
MRLKRLWVVMVTLEAVVVWEAAAQGICNHVNIQRRPDPCAWAANPEENRNGFLNWLILGCNVNSDRCGRRESNPHVEYEGYDGWYNNFARPSQGAVDTPLLRLLPPAYKDGVYEPANRTTNPLYISRMLMSGNNGMLSRGGRTAFLVFFGQQVVEEILDAQGAGCPPEYFNIPVEENHEYFTDNPKLKELPLLRTRYDMTTGFSPNNPRQQLNEITPYMDGGLVYGTAKGWADVLRTFSNGSLAPDGLLAWHDELGEGFPAQNTQRLPMANPPPPTNHSEFVERSSTAPVDRFFKLGNPRGNENPFLLTFGIFWFRWHNVIARFLRRNHIDWSDERVFNEARKWVIATYQAVVFYDWLPKYMREPLERYPGYKPTTDPQVSHVFQSAAMRFGHTLVTSGVHLRKRSDDDCTTEGYTLVPGQGHHGGVRTCNSFWRSPEIFTQDKGNFENFLMGLSSQSTEREDNIIVEDLRGRVFGPLEFSRRDLMAVNIQRARDHGLPDYNTARKHFGFETLNSLNVDEFKQKTSTHVPDEVIERLAEVYDNDPNKVDIWAGGLLETRNGPGQLFSRVILDQFRRIREGDRFWFENLNNNLFTDEERKRIKQVNVIDVLLSVTNLVSGKDIQLDPFTAVHLPDNTVSGECLNVLSVQQPCQLLPRNTTCRYLPQVSNDNTEACTPPGTYDYFSGSEASYVLSFTLVLAACVALLILVIVKDQTKVKEETRRVFSTIAVTGNVHKAKERVASMESRYVKVVLAPTSRHIKVQGMRDQLLRTIDLRNVHDLLVRHLQDYTQIVVTVSHHYDLFLKFEDGFHGERLYQDLDKFCQEISVTLNSKPETKSSILRGIMTVYQREKQLAEFSMVVMKNAFGDRKKAKATENLLSLTSGKMSDYLTMEITQHELANQLGMLPDSIFVTQLFRLMDTDQSGFITIKEFWDVMVVFAQGKPEEKAWLIFSIYDISNNGYISADDLMSIVKSTLGSEGKNRDLDQVVKTMLESVGLQNGQFIDFEQFQRIFDLQGDIFKNVNIDMQEQSGGNKDSRFSLYGSIPVGGFVAEAARKEYEEARKEVLAEEEDREPPVLSTLHQYYKQLVNKFKVNIVYIYWKALYTLVMLMIFVERAYYYSVEREHAGLRRIAGYGVTITRGAASAMMFTYSTLLITMCRNLFSVLRSTALHRLFPFDYMIDFHRYIGEWALIWTVVHVIGHAINFYHISTQTPSDLTCLFRDYFRRTHVLPKFHYWCWETITGLTGVFLTFHTAVIYIFAHFGRKHYFPYFWHTHNSYPLFYFLFVLHGSGRLVQPPFFHFFFLGPCVLFVLDKLVSISRNKIKIDVISAQHLPSSVIRLEIRRPPNFSFQSGQWVKIASTGIGEQEYHPFTLSSAPHEENLTLHIRAVGPWTKKLIQVYQDQGPRTKYPQIYMDGPFGEGHQTWWDYEVVVLVAGGIGVTPFASILKDIAHKLQNSRTLLKTKKVIFLWTTRSQKQYEWMTDILREVETLDRHNVIRNHVFITQFKSKFDLRTIMLYLAERHFQRVSGTSLFTGLRAITHFSRPNFTSIFKSIKSKYNDASVVGVFTCGSPNLSQSVEHGCQEINKEEGPVFRHYYENF